MLSFSNIHFIHNSDCLDDVHAKILTQCHGQPECAIPVNDQFLGDPCYRTTIKNANHGSRGEGAVGGGGQKQQSSSPPKQLSLIYVCGKSFCGLRIYNSAFFLQ